MPGRQSPAVDPATPRHDVGFRIVLASAPLEIESYSLTIPNGIS
jgi:hypothetical protein